MLLYIFISGMIGLLFGSFSTVIIERWHSGKGGILLGRSECIYCKHQLGAIELIPLVSFLMQRGRCKNCKKKISYIYPLSEISMSIVFMIMAYISWSFGYTLFDYGHIYLLALGFITAVYMIYDIRFTEIPDQMMVPAICFIIMLHFGAIYSGDIRSLFFDLSTYNDSVIYMIRDHVLGGVILYTFFYLQILIPGGWYLIRQKEWKHLGELLLSYFLFPIILIVGFFIPGKKESNIDIPTWIGGGDLRIALFIGITIGSIHGVISIFIAYIIGSVYAIGYIAYRKVHQKGIHYGMSVPFGPFLGLGWIITILFHGAILAYIQNTVFY